MIKILVTGENGYVGNRFKKWMEQWPEDYVVEMMSVRGDTWKHRDFSYYDVIVHAAAIVHKKERARMKDRYFEINRDLTVQIARKAKISGVMHFLFISSMAV